MPLRPPPQSHKPRRTQTTTLKALQALNPPQPPRAIEGENGTQNNTTGRDGGEPPARVLQIIDEIHAEKPRDQRPRR